MEATHITHSCGLTEAEGRSEAERQSSAILRYFVQLVTVECDACVKAATDELDRRELAETLCVDCGRGIGPVPIGYQVTPWPQCYECAVHIDVVDRTPSDNLGLLLAYVYVQGGRAGTATVLAGLTNLYGDRDWAAALDEAVGSGFLTAKGTSYGTTWITLTATGILTDAVAGLVASLQ